MSCHAWTISSSSSGKVGHKMLASPAEQIIFSMTKSYVSTTSRSEFGRADLPFVLEFQGSAVFYDNWVARDMNGTALENAPFEAVFRDPDSSHRFQRHLPIQVQSCWNGIAILDPAPMYAHPHVRFRMARLGEGECSASECSLICNDYWQAGYGRIIMVPRVRLAYDKQVFDSKYRIIYSLAMNES